MHRLLAVHAVALVAGNVVLPFYILFLNTIVPSYTVFSVLYAVFTLAATSAHLSLRYISTRYYKHILIFTNLSSALAMYTIPSTTTLWHVVIIQIILGMTMAYQKSIESITIAKVTPPKSQKVTFGNHHAFLAISTACAIILAGVLIDTFSLIFMFYLGSFFFFVAGLLSFRIKLL